MNVLFFLVSCIIVTLFARICERLLGSEGLIAWIALCSVLANLFVLKQINLLGLNAAASDIFAVSSLLGLNLLQEKKGFEIAQKAIATTFLCLLFFCIMAQMHLLYIPSIYDTQHHTYAALLSPTPRLLIASLLAYFISQQTCVFLYRKLHQNNPKTLWRNHLLSTLVAQLFDTLIFASIGLWGLVSALDEIIIVGYLIKIAAIIATTFFSKTLWKSTSHVTTQSFF